MTRNVSDDASNPNVVSIADNDRFKLVTAAGAYSEALWSLIKSTHKTYFDTLYAPLGVKLTGDVVQAVHTQTGAVATGTTVIPADDTIPQNTEGDQYMSLAITPVSASNKLVIEVVIHLASSIAAFFAAALFQDTTADALAAAACQRTASGMITQLIIRHEMTAGTTSETTFKVRAGAHAAGTTTFNGVGGGRLMGGAFVSSIRIAEIKT